MARGFELDEALRRAEKAEARVAWLEDSNRAAEAAQQTLLRRIMELQQRRPEASSDVSDHDAVVAATNLCYRIEKCGASPALTDASMAASALRSDVMALSRDIVAAADMNCELRGRVAELEAERNAAWSALTSIEAVTTHIDTDEGMPAYAAACEAHDIAVDAMITGRAALRESRMRQRMQSADRRMRERVPCAAVATNGRPAQARERRGGMMAAFGQDSPTMMANIERGNTMEGREIERLRARVAELDAERDLAYEREAHAIATVASDESIIANLRTRVTELEALLSTQWPGRDVVAQITKGTSYLLAECNYDWDGWEQLQAARDEAVAWLALRGEDAP